MEGVFPNELSLQQVRVARPFSAVLAALRPLGVPWPLTDATGDGEGSSAPAWPWPCDEGNLPHAIYLDGAWGTQRVNDTLNRLLGVTTRTRALCGPEREEPESEAVPAPQAFSEYQVQQMTATFVDQFGFNDEEFADQDDSVK